MLISQLKQALDTYLLEYGDTEAVLYWEQGCIDEGFDEDYEEPITDVRVVPDWPLPGCSLTTAAESPQMKLVIFYGEYSRPLSRE